jgi:hypothetical protein
MLNEIPDLPAGVIGFELEGELETADYRDVLGPAVERAAAGGDVRMVMVIAEYEGVSGGAMWEDLKLGVGHWGKWKRIALVTDIDWLIRGTEWFGWMIPGEIKRFPLSEREEAIAWAAS